MTTWQKFERAKQDHESRKARPTVSKYRSVTAVVCDECNWIAEYKDMGQGWRLASKHQEERHG